MTTWNTIPQNTNWEYDSDPPNPGGALSALWQTSTNGIRTNQSGDSIYTNVRHKTLHAGRASVPSEISKTFWDLQDILSDIDIPSAAYSLRNLTNDRYKNVVNVRRSDDEKRAFTANELLNGELESWVGSSSYGNGAWVETWYDQSGLGRDATMTDPRFNVPNRQPQIVNNGSLILSNGRPSLLFDSSRLTVSQDITGEDFGVYAVVEPNLQDPSTDGYIFDNLTSYGRGLLHDDYYSGRFVLVTDTTSTTPERQRVEVALEPSNGTPALQLISGVIDNTQTTASSPNGSMALYNVNTGDSEVETYENNEIPFQENTFVQYIGAGSGTGSNPFDGYISELIIYTGDSVGQSDNRLKIQTNINNYYFS